MSTLVLSPKAQHRQPHLDNSSPSPPASSSSFSSFKLSFTPQSLPPLLSRLPPALLASAESLPIPITPLVPEGKFTYGDTKAIPSSISSIISKTSSASSSSSPSSAYSNTSSNVSVGYTESHLPAIDSASLALHYALYDFRVLDLERYATAQYEEAFNWSEIHLPLELAREWYIVAFRSVRRKGADTALLYQADREAHEEAVTAGGLLLYWYGSPNEEGENLATCIWQSRKHALVANRNPKHAIAAKLASATYETYNLERYVLRKEKGRTSVSVVPWKGGDVGF